MAVKTQSTLVRALIGAALAGLGVSVSAALAGSCAVQLRHLQGLGHLEVDAEFA
jgi:hypothetical protein